MIYYTLFEGEPKEPVGLTARRLLCHALKKEYGISQLPPFSYGEMSKPYFTDKNFMHFNLSHCRIGVACALSDQEVGIDFQDVRNVRLRQKIAGRDCSNVEFAKLWSVREAVGKLNGRGIFINNTVECEHFTIPVFMDGTKMAAAYMTTATYNPSDFLIYKVDISALTSYQVLQ